MNIILIILGIILLILSYLLNKKLNKHEDLNFNIKEMQGIVPGGIYNGIMFIPGDPKKDWVKKEKYSLCPACEKGMLFYCWQDKYYHLKCDLCGYLHDTGEKLSQSAIEMQNRIIKEILESENLQ